MGAMLKLWRQIAKPTPSVDAYLYEEHSCQISSRFDLKRRRLRLLCRGRPNKKKNNNMNKRI